MWAHWSLLLFFVSIVSAWPEQIHYNHENNWAESGGYYELLDSFVTGAGQNTPYNLVKINAGGNVEQYSQDITFIPDDVFTLGTKVNDERFEVYFVQANMSLLFGADPTPDCFQSGFVVADIDSGGVKEFVDLSELVSFPDIVSANDVVLHFDNYFYITDLFGRLLRASGASAEIFLVDDSFKRDTLSGINGIVSLDEEHLILGNFDESTLLKVNTQTKEVIPIEIVNGGIVNPDGLTLGPLPFRDLFVVQNVQGASQTTVARLRSNDNWHSAHIVEEQTSPYGGGSALFFVFNEPYLTHSAYLPPDPQANTGVLDRLPFSIPE